MRCAKVVPALFVGRGDAPEVELEFALGGAGFGEGCVWAVFLCEVAGGGECVEVDLFLNACGQSRGLRASRRARRSWKKTSCRPMTPRPTGRQRALDDGGLRDGVVVDVDDAVEHRDGVRGRWRASFSKSKCAVRSRWRARLMEPRLQTAVSVARGDFGDFGAEVGEMDDVAGLAGLVALEVAGVLEDHPAVAGLGERAHHAGVEVAGLDLARVELLLLRLRRRLRSKASP